MENINPKAVILAVCLVALTMIFALPTPAIAAEPESCKTPRFANIGWTDTTATTSTALLILESIGYEPEEINLSIPITYAGMKNGDIDIYLGDWEPAMEKDVGPYRDAGDVEVLQPANLTGAKYTIAVPKFVADAGVRDFADIAKHADKFDRKFYGLEPGDSGGSLILEMIEQNKFGLGEFELVESSEQGMLAQVARRVRHNEWIAFLAWEPHPMNVDYDLVYLTGGDDFFGPNFGGAEVFSNVRRGYLQECENVGAFVQNLKFTLEMENSIMAGILNDGKEPKDAALDWLKKNPAIVDAYLAGIKTYDGKDARQAFRNTLDF